MHREKTVHFARSSCYKETEANSADGLYYNNVELCCPQTPNEVQSEVEYAIE